MVANLLMARRYLENWVLWVTIDTVATVLYFQRGLQVVGVEYIIFFLMATYGLWQWRQLWLAERAPATDSSPALPQPLATE